MEQWINVFGFNDYEVSELGSIRKVGTTDLLKPCITNKYARLILYKEKKRYSKLVHRVVIESFKGYSELECDHKDTDTLNNKLSNLRYLTPRENSMFRELNNKNKKSKYVGVTQNPKTLKWVSRIYSNKKRHVLGTFNTEEEASIAYNKALENLIKQ